MPQTLAMGIDPKWRMIQNFINATYNFIMHVIFCIRVSDCVRRPAPYANISYKEEPIKKKEETNPLMKSFWIINEEPRRRHTAPSPSIFCFQRISLRYFCSCIFIFYCNFKLNWTTWINCNAVAEWKWRANINFKPSNTPEMSMLMGVVFGFDCYCFNNPVHLTI